MPHHAVVGIQRAPHAIRNIRICVRFQVIILRLCWANVNNKHLIMRTSHYGLPLLCPGMVDCPGNRQNQGRCHRKIIIIFIISIMRLRQRQVSTWRALTLVDSALKPDTALLWQRAGWGDRGEWEGNWSWYQPNQSNSDDSSIAH